MSAVSEGVAYQTIRRALAHAWPTDSDKDVRRVALAALYQSGTDPRRLAVVLQVVGAVRQGVDAGVWQGAHDVRIAGDILLAGLDFALGNVSSLELVMLLRQLSTGFAEAVGTEDSP